LTEAEVKSLNFIKTNSSFRFRRHHRQGLRSLIFEVLNDGDLFRETAGEEANGLKRFPRAVPRYMLRILRTRFTCLDRALEEIDKYRVVVQFFDADLFARSDEFIVEYTGTGKKEVLLCGLQEYVKGEVFDPWCLVDTTPLAPFYKERKHDGPSREARTCNAITRFVCQAKDMIRQTGYIPDLAGMGNLIVTPGGGFKLVDINNIIKMDLTGPIQLDDRCYPAGDKSVEVLAILEQKILRRTIPQTHSLYGPFLADQRKKEVAALEKQFYENLSPSPPNGESRM